MSEKEIVEVFVHVQEPEYYDRIMLLVGAKFAERVKICETFEDGLKSGKIARVAAKEKKSLLFHAGEGKPPEAHHIPKVVPGLPQSPIKLVHAI